MKPAYKILGWTPPLAAVATLALVYTSWAVAYWQLGRRPRPSMDDPSDIGGLSTQVTNYVSSAVYVTLLLWAISMIAVLCVVLWPKSSERNWWLKRFGVGLVSMALLFLSMHHSPGNAVMWFLD